MCQEEPAWPSVAAMSLTDMYVVNVVAADYKKMGMKTDLSMISRRKGIDWRLAMLLTQKKDENVNNSEDQYPKATVNERANDWIKSLKAMFCSNQGTGNIKPA